LKNDKENLMKKR